MERGDCVTRPPPRQCCSVVDLDPTLHEGRSGTLLVVYLLPGTQKGSTQWLAGQ